MSNPVKTNKRILALDILRGVTIAGMIMVNNPGTWAHIYAPYVMRNGTVLPHRPCISVFHVHNGNFHVHIFEKV